ncbi:MAG: hypothetical protein FJ100_08065 [Deltaproteobacteria bacterium]|nr:hypothetical protein [Deltaproteobacteria bacterium]
MNRPPRLLFVLAAALALPRCASDPKPAATADGATTADTAVADGSPADGAVADTAKADATKAETGTGDATTASDTKAGSTGDAKPADVAKKLPTCAEAAGGWVVTGTCSTGGASIPYACMKAKDCTLTWETDYRNWSGPLTGATYALKNGTGSEKIDGTFESMDTGSYTYAGPGITCNATMERFVSTVAPQPCCDPVGQDCADKNTACVPMAEQWNGQEILTTGCLPLADGATTSEGAVCKLAAEQPCAAGLLCARPVGVSSGSEGTCKKLCAAATHCGSIQSCVIVGGAPKTGVCSATCGPFATAGDPLACPAGFGCSPAAVASAQAERELGTVCLKQGNGKAGDACTSSTTCAPGTTCNSGQCRPLCDDAHPCAAGACAGFGLPEGKTVGKGFGYCK